MYADLAGWWQLLSAPEDYAEEAAFFHRILTLMSERPVRTLLELGSGGGNNASHLKAHYQMTLVDRSPAMLAVSRALNPECEHLEGDMRTVRLEREYDAVFIHDAIVYMTSLKDLRRAIQTAYVHCREGGVVLLVPDYTRETFQETTDHGGHDGDGRGMRYLEWTYDPDASDNTYVAEYAYLLREADGRVRVAHDRHVCGLFARQGWVRELEAAGLAARVLLDPDGRDVFVGIKSG
jgi:trans-aconitate methyltransferase